MGFRRHPLSRSPALRAVGGSAFGRQGGTKLSTRPRRQDGMALVLVLLVIAVLSLLGIAGTRSAQTELQMGQKDLVGRQALSVAEAGINHAYSLISTNAASRPNPPSACDTCWGFDSELSSGSTRFPDGVFGNRTVLVSGGATMDGFDSRDGAYSAATAGSIAVRSDGNVSVSGTNTAVKGDAIAGGTVSLGGGATVTGTTTDN